MDITITVKKPTQIKVDAIRVVLPVHYEDEDIPRNFPMRKGDVWEAVIDIATGQIRDWPVHDQDESMCMKVTDSGCYYLLSGTEQVAFIEQDYVPKCIPGKWGDYVEFEIDKHGVIVNWKSAATVENIQRSFFGDDED